jgi:quinol monooxygenase YgiN
MPNRHTPIGPSTPFPKQLQQQTGPVVLVNTFLAPDGKIDEVLAAWKIDAEYFRGRPGFISTQLHRGIAGSNALVNVAVWESAEKLGAAINAPGFQATRDNYPDGTITLPHLYEKIAVEGICVA